MYVHHYMIKFRICDVYIIFFVQNISTNNIYMFIYTYLSVCLSVCLSIYYIVEKQRRVK